MVVRFQIQAHIEGQCWRVCHGYSEHQHGEQIGEWGLTTISSIGSMIEARLTLI